MIKYLYIKSFLEAFPGIYFNYNTKKLEFHLPFSPFYKQLPIYMISVVQNILRLFTKRQFLKVGGK